MLFKDNLNKNEFLRQLYNVNLLTFAKIYTHSSRKRHYKTIYTA